MITQTPIETIMKKGYCQTNVYWLDVVNMMVNTGLTNHVSVNWHIVWMNGAVVLIILPAIHGKYGRLFIGLVTNYRKVGLHFYYKSIQGCFIHRIAIGKYHKLGKLVK